MKKILSIILCFILLMMTSCKPNTNLSIHKEKDIAETNEKTLNATTTTTTIVTTTTEPPMLSDDCDLVLAKGEDENGNYYELVANQIDGYPDSTFEFGVIKNNIWLVEMSSTCPFIDEHGWWKGLNKEHETNMTSEEDFEYIGSSLFLYKNSILYNPETNVSFENLCNRDYTEIQNYNEFVGFESYHEEGTANHYVYFKHFNTQTGESKEIKGYFKDTHRPEKLNDISDGLFYAYSSSVFGSYNGFFDLKGNMVLDLSEYSITDYHNYKFENGEYTITCTNNSDVEYNITFNTSGKVINTEKL